MKIYDVHSHFGPTSSGEVPDVSDLKADLQNHGISKVGLSCLSGISTREQNDLIYKLMQLEPDFIEGYAYINPKDGDALEEVELCLGEYKMNGVKFHSWKQGYYPDNRPELFEIFDLIQQYGVHVEMHVGTAPLSTPYIWGEYAKQFPKIDFLFTHTGYYEFGMSSINVASKLDNVWVETSGQMNPEVLKRAVNVLGSERVVFGTDWPYKPVNIEVEKFEHLGLKEEQLENILYKNAEYLWRYR